MSKAKVVRPRHAMVLEALSGLHADALLETECYFGGGTRIVLALGEYRESADVDFLCANRAGYRALRASVTQRSLGMIARRDIKLAREVIADRYGIRTFLDMGSEKLKFEIVLEGRIELTGGKQTGLPVPALDQTSCFAEKFLANADRWIDTSVLGRDVIDLAFMTAHWGEVPLRAGLQLAANAYGKVAKGCARQAAAQMIEQAAWRNHCVKGLDVNDSRTLLAGLKGLVASLKSK